MKYLFFQNILLLQDIAKPELINFLSIRDVTISGVLILAVWYFYRRTNTLEVKVDEYIKQRDEENKKYAKDYYDLALKINDVLSETNRQTNETNKLLQKLQNFLDKTQN